MEALSIYTNSAELRGRRRELRSAGHFTAVNPPKESSARRPVAVLDWSLRREHRGNVFPCEGRCGVSSGVCG